MKLHKIILALLLVLHPVGAFAENIDPNSEGLKYAWGENVGWINLAPIYCPGVTVSNSRLSGFAWGENVGWINLSPIAGGVNNDGNGVLSGYAWGENVGWINFAPTEGGVFVDPNTGLFSGYAWGENTGWINFAPTGTGIRTSWDGTLAESLTAMSETKLIPSDIDASSLFGHAVAISGNVAVVGKPLDDDNGSASGSAYIYRNNGMGWIREAKLTASDAALGDYFGRWNIATSGDRVLVGATGDDDKDSSSGSAYVFRYNGTDWVEEAKLTASDGALSDFFGWGLAISGDTAVVGASNKGPPVGRGAAYVFRFDGTNWVEEDKLIPSDITSNFGRAATIRGDLAVVGAYTAVYVFRRTGTSWTQEAKLTVGPSYPSYEHLTFGISVALSADKLVVGEPFDDHAGPYSGAAYVFRRTGTSWTQEAKLTASDATVEQAFGNSVSISGDMAVIGTGHHTLGPSGGAAYVFRYDGKDWIEGAKIINSDNESYDRFGYSVSISGSKVLCGAYWDDYSGSAYVYDLEATTSIGRCISVNPIIAVPYPIQVVVIYDEVVDDGTTTATPSTAGSLPPAGYEEVDPSINFDVTTTAITSGSTIINVDYSGIGFENEEELRLFHEENGEWVDITTSQDTVNDTLTGVVNHLSLFAIFERQSEPGNIVIDGCDTGVSDQIYIDKFISEWIGDCAAGAENHGQFVSCVAHLTNDLKKFGLITDSEKGAIQSCAAQADITK